MANLPTNNYGNVDISKGVPSGYVHINAKRLTITCASIDVECAPAFIGWTTGTWSRPQTAGVVIHAEDEDKVREAMAKRASKRLTPAQKAVRREAKQRKDTAQFAQNIRAAWPRMPEVDVIRCAEHTTEIGSRRVGRSSTAEDPVRAAVVAYARHRYTTYDTNFDFVIDKTTNRENIRKDLEAKLAEWKLPSATTQNPQSLANKACK